MTKPCPYCDEDDKAAGSGCCFCDHKGYIRIPGEYWETEEQYFAFKEARDEYLEKERSIAVSVLKRMKEKFNYE